jgi:hypothetical protein
MPEYPREYESHQQAPGSQNEYIRHVADVELPDVAHKEVSNC